ncbi:hypothetical protein BHM03_00052521, partial [Ensete ventricosum]
SPGIDYHPAESEHLVKRIRIGQADEQAWGFWARRIPPWMSLKPIRQSPNSPLSMETDRVPSYKSSAASGAKAGISSTGSVHELLECPVCTNSMYPPIHQVPSVSILSLVCCTVNCIRTCSVCYLCGQFVSL